MPTSPRDLMGGTVSYKRTALFSNLSGRCGHRPLRGHWVFTIHQTPPELSGVPSTPVPGCARSTLSKQERAASGGGRLPPPGRGLPPGGGGLPPAGEGCLRRGEGCLRRGRAASRQERATSRRGLRGGTKRPETQKRVGFFVQTYPFVVEPSGRCGLYRLV